MENTYFTTKSRITIFLLMEVRSLFQAIGQHYYGAHFSGLPNQKLKYSCHPTPRESFHSKSQAKYHMNVAQQGISRRIVMHTYLIQQQYLFSPCKENRIERGTTWLGAPKKKKSTISTDRTALKASVKIKSQSRRTHVLGRWPLNSITTKGA